MLAWALMMLWPFSGLVHAWSIPIQYLGRPPILYRSPHGGALPSFLGTAAALRRVLEALPPASGSAVMGTGVVSLALHLDGRESLSKLLMWIAVGVWVALAALLVTRFTFQRSRFIAESASPTALTGVSGAGVLGTRLTVYGWDRAGIVALVVSGLLLLGLA
ncbi:MAG: SLAC1 family transporter [Solirubrobacteraceae bacterium]